MAIVFWRRKMIVDVDEAFIIHEHIYVHKYELVVRVNERNKFVLFCIQVDCIQSICGMLEFFVGKWENLIYLTTKMNIFLFLNISSSAWSSLSVLDSDFHSCRVR